MTERGAAIERLLTHTGPSNACGLSPDAICGFCLKRIKRALKPAASVQPQPSRKEVVEEAFEKLMIRAGLSSSRLGTVVPELQRVVDAILADLEKNDGK